MSKKDKKKKEPKLTREMMDDLRKEVNNFDKSFGMKLKEINPFGEPEMVFQQYVSASQDFLLAVVYEINGITQEQYLTEKRKRFKELKDGEFTSLSILEWDNDDYYNPDSYTFRCRFLTLFIIDFLDQLENVTLRKYDYLSRFKTGKYENGYFYMQGLARDLRRFINVMLSGNSYGNIFLQVHQNCSYMKVKKTDPKELNKYIKDIRYELKQGLKETLFNKKDMPEDIAIDSILKLTYLISTGNTDLDNLPKFRYIEGADTSYELRGLIEALGSAIMDEKKYEKRPIMYQAYMNARPKIMSKYEDINENWLISVGVRSLEYTKFFCNDKYISRFIDKMLH